MKRTALLWSIVLVACGDPVADATLSVKTRIELVSPGRVPLEGGTEISVVGVNFDREITGKLDGAAITLIRDSDHLLRFIAPPHRPGPVDLVLEAPFAESVTSTGALRYAAETLEIATRIPLSTARFSSELGVGDLDGDGLDDVVAAVVEIGAMGYFVPVLHPFLNRDQGRVLEELPALPGQRDILFVKDVDRDGLADAVTSQAVFLSKGKGAFGPPLMFPSAGTAVLADFDPAPGLELMVIASPGRKLFKVEGGALRELRALSGICLSFTLGLSGTLIARDIDGDGLDDLVFLGCDNRLHVAVAPTFDVAAGWGSASESGAIVQFEAVDLNGDRRLDLVVGSYDRGSYFLNTGGGQFGPEARGERFPCGQSHALRSFVTTSSSAILVACQDARPAYWRAYPADLNPSVLFGPTDGLRGFQTADLDGDGYRDLVGVSDEGLFALFGYFPGFVSGWGPNVRTSSTTITPYVMMSLGKFGPQRPAVVGYVDQLAILESSRGVPELGPRLTLPDHVYGLSAIDVDGDGIDEVAVVLRGAETHRPALQLYRLENDALRLLDTYDGPVNAYTQTAEQPMLSGLALLRGDFDGDGDLDLLLANQLPTLCERGTSIPGECQEEALGKSHLLRNLGTGRLSNEEVEAPGLEKLSYVSAVQVGPDESKGRDGLTLVAGKHLRRWTFFEGAGFVARTSTLSVPIYAGAHLGIDAATLVEEGGKTVLWASGYADSGPRPDRVVVRAELGADDQTRELTVSPPLPSTARLGGLGGLVPADVDGDGDLDLTAAGLFVMRYQDGKLEDPYETPWLGSELFWADIDGDGLPDLLSPGLQAGRVFFAENRSR